MVEVNFTQQAYTDLYTFIVHYEDSFLELYSDSGIWAEDQIISNYRKSAESLYERIYENTLDKLSKETVLGRKEIGRALELSFYVGNRLIMVVYSEDKENNTRWVESIFINKKPIIF